MAKPKSHTLFHFTKSRDILEKILKTGFWPKYCLEDISWLANKEFDFIAFPMVCFCDIPLSRIDEHVDFYGSFGIGMSKEWAVKNDMNPILYMAGQNSLAKSLTKLESACEDLEEDIRFQMHSHLRRLASHIKPTEGAMTIGGSIVRKEFYQESEWRYTPVMDGIADHAVPAKFEDEIERKSLNEKTAELAILKFLPSDIKYLFVPTDADIPAMINFIQVELDHYPGSELKVLMSRVTSLETVKRDY